MACWLSDSLPTSSDDDVSAQKICEEAFFLAYNPSNQTWNGCCPAAYVCFWQAMDGWILGLLPMFPVECSLFRACVVADWVCISPPARCFAVGLTTSVFTSSTRTSTRRWWWWLPATTQSGQWAGLTGPDPNWPDLTPFDLTQPGQTRTDMTFSTDLTWSDLAHCDFSPLGNGVSSSDRRSARRVFLIKSEVLNTSGHITFLRNSAHWLCTPLKSSFLCWTTASLVLYLTTDCVHTWHVTIPGRDTCDVGRFL